jgi:CheY-like chemotaxis protein
MSTEPRLLLVEDERNVAETLAERLRAAGYQVARADSVAGARRAIGEAPFELALLDVGLPDGSGFELARVVRQRRAPRSSSSPLMRPPRIASGAWNSGRTTTSASRFISASCCCASRTA